MLVSTGLEAAPQVVTRSVTIGQTTKILSEPFIQTDAGLYAPLRALADALNASLTYTRNTRRYTLQTADKHKLAFSTYSRAFWVNARLQYAQASPLYYNNHVYIPLAQWLPAIGYSVSKATGSLTLQKRDLVAMSDAPPSAPSDPFDFSTLANQPIQTLQFDETPYPTPQTYTKNGTLFVAANAILADHGYQITQTPTDIQYSQTHQTITLSTQTPTARVSDTLRTIPYQTEAPVSIVSTSNTVYIPLSVLHSVFNYSLSWQKKSQTLHVLKTLAAPEIMPLSAPIELTVAHSHTPETPQIVYSDNTIQLTLANSLFSQIGQTRYPKSYALNRVSWKSNPRATTPNSTIRLHFKQPHHIETRSTDRHLTIVAKPIVSAINQRILYNNGAEIHIVTTSPIHRNYQVTTENNQLHIALPGTHLAPQTIESESHYYDQISVSDTHITIPIRSKTPTVIPALDNQLTIRFQPDPDQKITKKLQLPSPALTPLTTKRQPLKRRVIAIDPGHGGSDPGAVGLYGIYEKDYNRDISNHLMRLLRQSGARVVDLRLSDRNPSLASRSSEANTSNADITVSVHVNSFYKEYANGTETYFYKWKDRRLAMSLQSAMTRELNLKDNGVKRAKMYILNHTTMPAALVEPAFMTNRKEAKKLRNPEFRARIAQSIHDGIVSYFESN